MNILWGTMFKAEVLHPQDVLVACRLQSLSIDRREWTYSGLARAVGISVGEAHRSCQRCRRSQLLTPANTIARPNLIDLLAVAVPRVFYAVRGGLFNGMPTSTWAPSLAQKFEHPEGSLPIVWPTEDGSGVRGEGVEPIYPTVFVAAGQDPLVYELLALADVCRVGGRAERSRAAELLERRIAGK